MDHMRYNVYIHLTQTIMHVYNMFRLPGRITLYKYFNFSQSIACKGELNGKLFTMLKHDGL